MKWIKSLVLVSALLIAGLVYSQTRVITDEWTLELPKNAISGPEMVPISEISGTVFPTNGLAGQNCATPAEKIFNIHYVIRYLGDNLIYDPSYGQVWPNANAFDQLDVDATAALRSSQPTNAARLGLDVRITNSAGNRVLFYP